MGHYKKPVALALNVGTWLWPWMALKYVHKLFHILPFKKWSPLPVWAGFSGSLNCGRSEMLWFRRLGHKRCCGFHLGSLALWRASCHVVTTLKHPHGEIHMVKNWGLLPRARTNLPGVQMNFLGWRSNRPFKPSDDYSHGWHLFLWQAHEAMCQNNEAGVFLES